MRRLKDWWNQPGGGREVVAVSLPLVVSTLSWTVMYFIDRMFLLWHLPAEFAAALPAAMMSFTVACFPLGVASYANAFVAQYFGAGRDDRVGLTAWQAVWVGTAFLPLYVIAYAAAPSLFIWAGHPRHLEELEIAYFQILCFGSGGLVIGAALSAFFIGLGRVRVVMIVDVSAALVNVLLDYVFIFGKLGLPEGGIVGAGWATVIAYWLKVVLLIAIMMHRSYRVRFQVLEGFRFYGTLFRRIFRYGTPNGVQYFLEVVSFTLFVFLVGRLGEAELAATNLAFNVNSLAFMPMFGVGMATITLVGQRLGEDRPDVAAKATWSAFGIGSCYILVLSAAYVLLPDLFLFAYGAGRPNEDFVELRGTTVVLLRFVAAYCFLDMAYAIFSSAIKGAGDVRFVMLTSLIMAPFPVIATWVGVEYFDYGLLWSWGAVTVWVCGMGMIYFLRFLQGNWRQMRVIEPVAEIPN